MLCRLANAVLQRLWVRRKLLEIKDHLDSLLKVIVSRAENEIDLLIPGYTHLQRAQPVRWSHWLLSYGSCFARDFRALHYVIEELNYCPLGCGALSGNVFGIDRRAIARELGFKDLCLNSMDAVSDRDFLLKTMGWGSDFMMHVSRIAQDLCIYSSQEFGFVKLADAYSTGSSLMPQKKVNPPFIDSIPTRDTLLNRTPHRTPTPSNSSAVNPAQCTASTPVSESP